MTIRNTLTFAIGASFAQSFTFTSSPASDLQQLFNINAPWLGADVSTSVRLAGTDNTYLWLHGDTLVGSMSTVNGVPTRQFQSMPRNSIAMLTVDPSTGRPSSNYTHYMRPANQSDPIHYGFWSPPENISHWYWPTAGVSVTPSPELKARKRAAGAYDGEQTFVLTMRTMDAGSGLFPFATAGVDVIALSADGGASAPGTDPWAWPGSDCMVGSGSGCTVSTLPNINNSFVIGANGVALSSWGPSSPTSPSDDEYVLLLGNCCANGQTGMMARIDTDSFIEQNWTNLQYWALPGDEVAAADGAVADTAASTGSWQPFSPSLQPVPLFDFVPSETTLQYHPVLQMWIIVVANTFITTNVSIRVALDVTGPWSDMIPLYQIPDEMLAGGAFCYAGKAHPELSPPQESTPGAASGQYLGELVFSFMCNTPTIPELLNRTDIYVPRLIRTSIYA